MPARRKLVPPEIEEVKVEWARRKFRRFVQQAWPTVEPARDFVPSWHIDAICDHLQAVAEGQLRNLVISVPPGHAKSLLVSVLFPAWIWTSLPAHRSLFSSYSAELAMRDSVRCRSVIESQWYREAFQPKWKLSDDQNQKAYFQNTESGFRRSLGVGGGSTGWRGDLIACDDPLNARDQHSDLALESCIFWWDNVMSSRLNDMQTGCKVIIMQRLAERDLAGHVLSRSGYEHLCLPSEFDPDRRTVTSIGFSDPRSTYGELLFPQMFPRAVIDQAKIDLGSTGFAAQHQQRPAPAEGSLFKNEWFRYWEPKDVDLGAVRIRKADGTYIEIKPVKLPDSFEEEAQSWDAAFKGNNDSDFVVGQHWGRLQANRYLLDQFRERVPFTGTVAAVREFSKRHPKAFAKLIEDKANGPAIIDTLRNEVQGLIACPVDGSKWARASAVSPQFEAGNVFIPHPRLFPWVEAYVAELLAFDKGANDDQVDATSQMLYRWSSTPDPRIRSLAKPRLGPPNPYA